MQIKSRGTSWESLTEGLCHEDVDMEPEPSQPNKPRLAEVVCVSEGRPIALWRRFAKEEERVSLNAMLRDLDIVPLRTDGRRFEGCCRRTDPVRGMPVGLGRHHEEVWARRVLLEQETRCRQWLTPGFWCRARALVQNRTDNRVHLFVEKTFSVLQFLVCRPSLFSCLWSLLSLVCLVLFLH